MLREGTAFCLFRFRSKIGQHDTCESGVNYDACFAIALNYYFEIQICATHINFNIDNAQNFSYFCKRFLQIIQSRNIVTMMKLKRLSPREAYAAYVRGHLLVDVREADKGKQKLPRVNHLVQLPMSELGARFSELPTNQPIMLVSRVGNSSNNAAHFLLEHGFSNVAIVDGGLIEWEKEGLPMDLPN